MIPLPQQKERYAKQNAVSPIYFLHDGGMKDWNLRKLYSFLVFGGLLS